MIILRQNCTSRSHYQNKSKFNIWCDIIPNTHNIKFQFILRWFAYGSPRVVFCGRIESRIKTSSKLYQNKPKVYIYCDLTTNRQNMKLQLILRWFAYSSLKIVFQRQNWIIPQISTNLSLSLSHCFNILIWLETITRWNITFFFLRWRRHWKTWRENKENEKNRRIWPVSEPSSDTN
jgi:hypothetical protein